MTLLAARDVSPGTQQLQDDAMNTLRDLLQFIAFEKAVDESASEIKRRNGVDAFQRKFLLRDKDLDAVTAILLNASHAKLLQRDVARKLARFSNLTATNAIESANRTRAAVAQKKGSLLIESIRAQAGVLSADAATRVREASLDALLAIKLPTDAEITAGGKDKELAAAADDAAKALSTALQNLRDLLEERVQPKAETAAQIKKEEPAHITAEKYAKANSREALIERLKDVESLPPAIRDTMIRALSKEFPEKYKQLLTAYFASFGAEPKEKVKRP